MFNWIVRYIQQSVNIQKRENTTKQPCEGKRENKITRKLTKCCRNYQLIVEILTKLWYK